MMQISGGFYICPHNQFILKPSKNFNLWEKEL